MSDITEKAKLFISEYSPNTNIRNYRLSSNSSEEDWNRLSAKIYNLVLSQEKKERKKNYTSNNVACTSNEEISQILEVNLKLTDLALALPPLATLSDFKKINSLFKCDIPDEEKILAHIEKIILHPKIRALQKKGRFEVQEPFKEFVSLIDASTLSFYRHNYISSFMTLVPVIEGVILRWLNYQGHGEKPDFNKIKNFFSHSYMRHPYPCNIQFHNIFNLACHKIIKEHFFRNSQSGNAYSNFNRHLASHLLFDAKFATKENCIRLFVLLDLLSEIYLYESYSTDNRFYLKNEDINTELINYNLIKTDVFLNNTPEIILLNG